MLHLETIQTTLYLTALSLCLMAVVKKIAYGHNNNEGYIGYSPMNSNHLFVIICKKLYMIALIFKTIYFHNHAEKLYSNDMCY